MLQQIILYITYVLFSAVNRLIRLITVYEMQESRFYDATERIRHFQFSIFSSAGRPAIRNDIH